MDGFAPMGPCLATADELGDPENLGIRLRLNGETMQEDNTGSMIWGVADIIEYVSAILTLEPGDVISMGTPGGVGFARTPPRDLQPGDVVEAEIDGIGLLANPVEAE
jgi:2-keto-4-pentenoate hydratase/2-oxohepta-3-ene-1,7-dioic acid hydratase in catechol pathway